MRKNLIETVMGAVVLAVAALFIVFAYSKAEIGKVEGYEIKAKFDRVDGILAGSDVRMSGIKIGTVTSLALDQKTYFANVSMNIRSDIKIPEDTSIAVSSDGLLGDFLGLSPGGADEMLAPAMSPPPGIDRSNGPRRADDLQPDQQRRRKT